MASDLPDAPQPPMFKLELKEETFLDLYEGYKLRFGGFYKDRIQLEKSTRKSALQVDI